MKQLIWVTKLIEDWIVSKKIGSITINLFKGGIGNVVLKESLKPEEEITQPKN